MGNTREVIRDLLQLMLGEADTDGGYQDHLCKEYNRNGTCVLCASHRNSAALVHTSILRQSGALGPEMLNTELLLLDTVGQKRYNNMIREQTRLFCSGPSITCFQCNSKVKMYTPYLEAYKRILTVGGAFRVACGECEYINTFTRDNVTKPKGVDFRKPQKQKRKKIASVRRSRIALQIPQLE